MKKIVSFVLCMVLAFGVIGGVVPELSPVDISITAEAASKITAPYNYTLMTDTEKDAYKKIRSAVINCKKNVKLNFIVTSEQLDKFYTTLAIGDPLTFNLEDVNGETYSSGYTILKFDYYYSKSTYDKMMDKVNKKVDTILAKITDDMSTYNKLKLFHDELINRNTYVLNEENCDNIYGAFVTNRIKCVGYTVGFSYLCNQVGIKNTQAYSGNFMDGGEGHVWNKVYYNKKWYNIDCTFDDPLADEINNLSYNCFMIGDKAIARIHGENEIEFVFKTPKASDNSKSYYAVSKTIVSDKSEITSVLTKAINTSVKKKNNTVTIKFANKEVFNESKTALSKKTKNGGSQLIATLTAINKKLDSKNQFVDGICYTYFDEDSYTLNILFFYKNSKLSDYFTDTSFLDNEALDYLKKYGVK